MSYAELPPGAGPDVLDAHYLVDPCGSTSDVCWHEILQWLLCPEGLWEPRLWSNGVDLYNDP